MYVQFLIEDKSTEKLVCHVMDKLKVCYSDKYIDYDTRAFKGIGHIPKKGTAIERKTGQLLNDLPMFLRAFDKKLRNLPGAVIIVVLDNDKRDHTEFQKQLKELSEQNNKQIYDYVYETEGEEIKNFLGEIWEAMKESICFGLNAEGIIPGKLQLSKRAKSIYNNKIENEPTEVKRTRLLTAYAYAVSETNASGGEIVTAPTCGSCGVLPATLYYLQKEDKYTDEEIINALATAGIIGNIVKTNASISGAECGCQAEIGTACSMAAAACSQLRKLDIYKIEHAAEIAMEHHLGLTCDPIYGYVQIPCIERNAVAAIRAIDASNISMLLDENQKISFDLITETMYETGKDLRSHYRETSTGGLAKKYCRNKYYNTDME